MLTFINQGENEVKTKQYALAATLTLVTIGTANAQAVLTGDTKLACEAILCLAAPSKPSECNASIQKYFSIKHKKAKNTAKARQNFLALCPKQ